MYYIMNYIPTTLPNNADYFVVGIVSCMRLEYDTIRFQANLNFQLFIRKRDGCNDIMGKPNLASKP